MHVTLIRWALLWLLLAMPGAAAWAATVPIPPLDNPVIDTVDAITPGQAVQLREQAYALQERRGAQLQILVVATTGDEGIEAYAQRVFDVWRIGRAGIDDGVLVLVAVDDRRVRIQTGYGLEGAIPDAYAARIIDQTILPRFRQGEIGQGIVEGTTHVIGLIDGEPLPAHEGGPGSRTLPRDWRLGDTVVLLTLLAGFAVGRWPRPAGAAATPQSAEKKRGKRSRTAAPSLPSTWWRRPLYVIGIWLAGLATCAAVVPGETLPFAVVLGLLVPVAAVLGRVWPQFRALRVVMLSALAISGVLSIACVATGRPVPSLTVHGVLMLTLGIAVVLIGLQVAALHARWRHGRGGFFVRLVLLSLLTLAFAAGVAWMYVNHGRGEALGLSLVGGFLLYFAWAFGMAVLQKGRGGGGSSASSSRDRSSSGGSDWSGGGGRSGGGGASGSW